jgi:hypothetical protein
MYRALLVSHGNGTQETVAKPTEIEKPLDEKAFQIIGSAHGVFSENAGR